MDQALKIVIETVNQEALKQLQQNIDRDTEAINALSQAMNQGKISPQQFGQQSLVLGQNIQHSRAAMDDLGHASTGIGRGLGQLAFALDDLQYGFNAIVNNIPQIVMGLGGSAGLAGAIGIAAVGANQLIRHWDEFKGTLKDTAPIEAAIGFMTIFNERVKKGKEDIQAGHEKPWIDQKVADDVARLQIAWDKAADAAKRHTEEVNKTAEAIKAVNAVQGTKENERGDLFTKAMAAAGGGPAMAQAMADKAMAGLHFKTKEEQETARQAAVDHASRQLAEGMAGKAVAMGQFPRKLQDAQIDLEAKAGAQKLEKAQEERAHAEHVMAEGIKERRHKLDILERAGEDNEARMKEKQKRERIESLQDTKEAIEERTHAQLKALRGQRPAQILEGAKASLDLYQIAGGSHAREERAHKIREESRKLLKSIDEQLKKERRLVIEH